MQFRIILKAFNKTQIKNACNQLKLALAETNCSVIGHVSLPTRVKKFCVIRSPHVNKDSREHFEIRIFKHFIDIKDANTLVIQALAKLELPYEVLVTIKALK